MWWVLVILATSACATGGATTSAGPEGPAQTVYAPPSGTGPIVVLLSGHSGPGLYTVLLDGKDILTREQDGASNLRKAIARAQRSAQAIPGKAVVIGFSRGGGGALLYAASMPDLVSAVVAY